MRSGDEQRPARVELGRLLLHFRVARVNRPQVLQGKRMLLDRHEMQPAAARWIAPPGLQGQEKVEPEAEAGFQDDEALAAGPARRQVVAAEEHLALLGDAAGGV